jgi:hypothetical protein
MTDAIHAACTGCYEVIPVTPGQLFSLVLIALLTIALVAALFVGIDRYNRWR